MAEGIDAVAVDVGDGAGGGDVEVAVEKDGADGIAGLELRGVGLRGGGGRRRR